MPPAAPQPESPSALTRVSIVAGATGAWQVLGMRAIRGESLPDAPALSRAEGSDFVAGAGARWILRGVRSHERYLERAERERLAARQEGLSRPGSRLAVLIPIRKTDAWWNLPQDERRAIFEARSKHIAIGAKYLPAIARRLYHARDLGEPFDFLTWFELGDGDAEAFAELVGRLRETEEWGYVTREIEIRLGRDLAQGRRGG
jgi:chlorite dismutase